jgi:hypothetical protein
MLLPEGQKINFTLENKMSFLYINLYRTTMRNWRTDICRRKSTMYKKYHLNMLTKQYIRSMWTSIYE